MGPGWRRVFENMRQRVGPETAFVATSNARNQAMFKEATDFCAHLRLLERDLRSMHKEIDAKFVNLRAILASPLPRAYDEGQNGAVPCSEEAKLIGQGVAVERLQEAAAELKLRLEEEVIKPLRAWLIAYRSVAEHMGKLEAVRLDLDSRRRKVDALEERADKLGKSTPAAKDKERYDQEAEKLGQTLNNKVEKCNRTQNAFAELEGMVFNSLNTLVKDTGVLRDYTGLSLQIQQDCYQKAHSAFSTATRLLDYNSTTENHVFNQQPSAYHHQHLPVIEKAQSERAGMVRALSERPPASTRPPSNKGDMDGGRGNGVALYAAADDGHGHHDGGLAQYGIMEPGVQMNGGMQQQLPVSGMGAYPELPQQQQGGGGSGGNPYSTAYQQGPSATRYMTSPAPAHWQAQPVQY